MGYFALCSVLFLRQKCITRSSFRNIKIGSACAYDKWLWYVYFTATKSLFLRLSEKWKHYIINCKGKNERQSCNNGHFHNRSLMRWFFPVVGGCYITLHFHNKIRKMAPTTAIAVMIIPRVIEL